MEDKIFTVGYTTYLSKKKNKWRNWTSKIINIILEHKILSLTIMILIVCMVLNILLIYNFIRIIELSQIL